MHIFRRPDVLIATFLINILGLSIPIYIIHAINRYLGNGNLDTLIFLTVTVLFATCIEYLLRKYRKLIILNINNKNFKTNDISKNKYIDRFNEDEKIENQLNYIKTYPNKYDFNVQISFLDVPYILLFSTVIYLLSPLIFILYLFLAIIILIISFIHKFRQEKSIKNLNELRSDYLSNENIFKRNYINFKVYSVYYKILDNLKTKYEDIFIEKKSMDSHSYDFETLNSFLINILIIFVIMISLIEINQGDMQISSLIALNILVVRALLPIKLIPNIIVYWVSSKKNTNVVSKKANFNNLSINDLLPIEHIELDNISFINQNSKNPLFNQFSINFPKGTTTVITGENGSGKSTLFNIICGAKSPLQGNFKVNGIEIDRNEQKKISDISSIITQNPILISNTLFEHLQTLDKNVDTETIDNLLIKCNLKTFFSDYNEGINLNLKEKENLMSLGIKKRIALAQVFYKNSELIIFDEPTEGCDKATCQAFYNFLNNKISEKKIIIIFSNDPYIIQGADIVLELKKGSSPIYLKK